MNHKPFLFFVISVIIAGVAEVVLRVEPYCLFFPVFTYPTFILLVVADGIVSWYKDKKYGN